VALRTRRSHRLSPPRTRLCRGAGPTGEVSFAKLQLGKSYFRNAGVEHDVINNGPSEMVFVEIELKDTAIGKTV
jgi:hypothetical protein